MFRELLAYFKSKHALYKEIVDLENKLAVVLVHAQALNKRTRDASVLKELEDNKPEIYDYEHSMYLFTEDRWVDIGEFLVLQAELEECKT